METPTLKQLSIFDGLLLSDAGLSLSGNNARFALTSKHRSFVDRAKEELNFIPSWEKTTERDVYDKRTNKFYHKCVIRSHVNDFLTTQYHRWYPKGIKVVPKDLSIDKDVLEWWYIGDGHLERKSARPNSRRVQLATNCFTLKDMEFLKKQLVGLLGNNAVYIECKDRIIISKQSLCNMAAILKETPVIDYAYKYEFGQYRNKDYFKQSYKSRPLEIINAYRKKHKVRELNFNIIKTEIK